MQVQNIVNEISKYENHDKTKETKASNVIPAGKTVCRFIEYIDLGVQPQRPFQGQPKPSVETVKLVFELLGPKNIHEVTQDGKTVRFADKIYLTIPKILNTKSRFFKLYTKMKYGREDITHMAQMLGEAFTVELTHSTRPNKDGVMSTYTNPIKDGEYTFGAPKLEDPMTGEVKNLPVPDALSELKVFVWERPCKESWGSLFIEGTYQKNGVEVSKNFLQESILKAENYPGSPLQLLLDGPMNFTRAANALTGMV